MPSKAESGHAKNVANLKKLIGICKGFGAGFNPSRSAITLAGLNEKLAASQAIMTAVKKAEGNVKKTIVARKKAFDPLKSMGTQIMGALKSLDVLDSTIQSAKSVNVKIQGKRIASVKEKDAAGKTIKHHSVSRQSFDLMIDHYESLVSVLAEDAGYTPNETELSVDGLNALVADLHAKNDAANEAEVDFDNRVRERREIMYSSKDGLVALALDVKEYVKSRYKAQSSQYKKVNGVPFKTLE